MIGADGVFMDVHAVFSSIRLVILSVVAFMVIHAVGLVPSCHVGFRELARKRQERNGQTWTSD